MTDTAERRNSTSADTRRAYYAEHGYVVREQLVDHAICQRAIDCFRREIKEYGGYLYRQASANPERNTFDHCGNVLNSLLNPLSVNGWRFPGFRAVSEELLSQRSLFDAVSELLCEPAVFPDQTLPFQHRHVIQRKSFHQPGFRGWSRRE